MSASYTWDVFSTLGGFGSWSKEARGGSACDTAAGWAPARALGDQPADGGVHPDAADDD